MDAIIFWSIPVFIVSMLIEGVYAARVSADLYERRDTAANIAMGLANVLISLPMKFVILAVYFFVYHFRFFTIPADAWWSWAILLFADDFCYYWFHRKHHEVRMLWCTHVNHHSSERYNLAVALRQPWTEALTAPWFWLPLMLLGFHPLMVMTQQAINLLYQFFVHTQAVKKFPRAWEFAMNTPSHHRVHHGTNPQYIDRNYGGIFIFWDRLFGTFEPERETVRYGLTHNVGSYNPVIIAFHEWAAMFGEVWKLPGWRYKLDAVIGRPSARLTPPA